MCINGLYWEVANNQDINDRVNHKWDEQGDMNRRFFHNMGSRYPKEMIQRYIDQKAEF